MGQHDTKTRDWWRIGDAAVLFLYAGVVLWTIRYHEKWADEAQAWLIARDLGLKTIWFHELRYEGSPGLWHTILWVAQHVFHAKYGAISYIGAGFAILGAAVVLLIVPFPRAIRWLLLFGFFPLYQYAVLARPYVLFACFAFFAARQFRDRSKPQLFALAVALLACLTAHGIVLGAALACVYAARFIKDWRQFDSVCRRRFVYSALAIAALYLCLFFILLPPRDVEALNGSPLTLQDGVTRSLHAVAGALLDNSWLSLLVLAAFALWCYSRKSLWSFLLPVGGVVALYVYVDGWAHQQGTIFLALMAGLAIAWPSQVELSAATRRELLRHRGLMALVILVLCYHVYASVQIIRRDVQLPYSGAADCAAVLRSLLAEGKTIYGYQYGMVAVSAYFERPVFANQRTAYYHHSFPYAKGDEIFEQIRLDQPEYVVFTWWDPWDEQRYAANLGTPMEELGYSFAHASDGFLLTKAGWSHRQIYLIFQRNTAPKRD